MAVGQSRQVDLETMRSIETDSVRVVVRLHVILMISERFTITPPWAATREVISLARRVNSSQIFIESQR